MAADFVMYTDLPDSPYRIWLQGELGDWFGLPDGWRAEVIGGDILVSSVPYFGHNATLTRITEAVFRASLNDSEDPGNRWAALQCTGLHLPADEGGAIPDLLLIPRDRHEELFKTESSWVDPDDVELVVEVTSPTNAFSDREPRPQHRARNGRVTKSKWTSYARSAVGFYLLVDRDARDPRSTLYFDPDPARGFYRDALSWPIGEKISLPDPFGFEIDTAEWSTW